MNCLNFFLWKGENMFWWQLTSAVQRKHTLFTQWNQSGGMLQGCSVAVSSPVWVQVSGLSQCLHHKSPVWCQFQSCYRVLNCKPVWCQFLGCGSVLNCKPVWVSVSGLLQCLYHKPVWCQFKGCRSVLNRKPGLVQVSGLWQCPEL